MSARMRRLVATVLISCWTVALAGCGSISDDAQSSSLAALATAEPPPGALPVDPDCADQRSTFKSLPPSVLPEPGKMPARSTMAEIQGRGYLRVGVDQNSLQLGYFNPVSSSPQMEGFDIDVVREVARAIFVVASSSPRVVDHFIRYKALSTPQRQTAIEGGEVDIVASAYSIRCKRLRHMRFSSVYHRADARLLVLKHSRISSLDDPDARGQRICATNSSTTLDYLKSVSARTGIVPVAVPLRPDCLVKLQEGDVDAYASDDAILFGFQKQDPQTQIVGPSLECERWGLAMNRAHPDLVRFVNAVLVRLRRGRLHAIARTWLADLPSPPKGRRSCFRGFL